MVKFLADEKRMFNEAKGLMDRLSIKNGEVE